MKRHILMSLPSIMFLLLILGALVGCVNRQRPVPNPPPPETDYDLRLIAQGPFLTIRTLQKNGGYKTALFGVRTDEGPHEFVYPYPKKLEPLSGTDPCQVTHKVKLNGVEPFRGETSIDPAFKPLLFQVPTWQRKPDAEYFVTLDFPTSPYAIVGVGPLYPVRFQGDIEDTYVPLTQELKFKVHDPNAVTLVRTEEKTCGKEKEPPKVETLHPLKCGEMVEKYQDYFSKMIDPSKRMGEPDDSQRPFLKDELRRCSDKTLYIFLGIGLNPDSFAEEKDPTKLHSLFEDHGRRFFNDRLLPEIYGTQPIPSGRKIARKNLPDVVSDEMPPYRLIQATFRYPVPKPHPPLPVASTENCTSPPATATTTSPTPP